MNYVIARHSTSLLSENLSIINVNFVFKNQKLSKVLVLGQFLKFQKMMLDYFMRWVFSANIILKSRPIFPHLSIQNFLCDFCIQLEKKKTSLTRSSLLSIWNNIFLMKLIEFKISSFRTGGKGNWNINYYCRDVGSSSLSRNSLIN